MSDWERLIPSDIKKTMKTKEEVEPCVKTIENSILTYQDLKESLVLRPKKRKISVELEEQHREVRQMIQLKTELIMKYTLEIKELLKKLP